MICFRSGWRHHHYYYPIFWGPDFIESSSFTYLWRTFYRSHPLINKPEIWFYPCLVQMTISLPCLYTNMNMHNVFSTWWNWRTSTWGWWTQWWWWILGYWINWIQELGMIQCISQTRWNCSRLSATCDHYISVFLSMCRILFYFWPVIIVMISFK